MTGMGLRDLKKRLTATVEELDDQRLQQRFHGIGLTPIGEVQLRVPIRVGGEVQRIRMVPRAGSPSLEVLISDGTGDVVAVFTGRRSIGGIEHGRAMLVEGVAFKERARNVIVNPAYTLLP
jgi:hypothetical protein